jgi:hypothetical protein
MIGRQIRFFFTPIDENLFLAEMKPRGDALVTDTDVPIPVEDASSLNDNSHSQVWITSPNSRIYRPHGYIDRDRSEVIEYSRSISLSYFTPPHRPMPTFEEYVARNNQKDSMGAKVFHKGKFIQPSEIPLEDLREKFDAFVKSREKTPDTRSLGQGRLWAAMRYVDNHQWAEKEHRFKAWYDSYAKWIKKHCRLSKNKDSYIGEDAYKAYKEGRHVIAIEFE